MNKLRLLNIKKTVIKHVLVILTFHASYRLTLRVLIKLILFCRSMTPEELELRTRDSIKHVRCADIRKPDAFMDAVCPVDCITNVCGVHNVAESAADFKNVIKEHASLLKPGGTLLCVTTTNSSRYEVGGQQYRYPYLTFEYLFECLHSAGMNDVAFKWFPGVRTNSINETFDFIFISAKLTHPQ